MAAPFNWHWTQWIMEWWCGPPLSGGGPPLHVKTISLVLRVRKCHPLSDHISIEPPFSIPPPLLPSVVLLSLLLFREWISRSVSPFSKRIGYAPVSVERKDFSLFLDLIFFTNDGRGSDGFIHCFRSKAKSKFALSNLEGNERYVSSEFTLSSELRVNWQLF